MSPRKSSTSSGNATRSLRPRYLGIEVAGEPAFSTRWLESTLLERLRAGRPDAPPIPVRVIRREGDRAVAEVEHAWTQQARASWNARLALPSGTPVELVTRRTWGTLRGAKAWLRERPRARTRPPTRP